VQCTVNIPGCYHPLLLLTSAFRQRSKTSSDGSVLAVEAAASTAGFQASALTQGAWGLLCSS
jgi:hypothetical protein